MRSGEGFAQRLISHDCDHEQVLSFARADSSVGGLGLTSFAVLVIPCADLPSLLSDLDPLPGGASPSVRLEAAVTGGVLDLTVSCWGGNTHRGSDLMCSSVCLPSHD